MYVLGIVLAGGRGERLYPLTEHRAKPAVPFAGRYRIIDFVLSKEGQELIVKTDRSSVRKDVTGNPLDLIKNVRVVPSDLSLGKDYIRIRDEYRQFLAIKQ